MRHGISLPLAAGVGSSNDLTTQGDLAPRRSKRFKSKVLPYWDFVRIACIPSSDSNRTVIAQDVPGEGTIILQELQPSGMVESSVKVEPPQTKPGHLAKNKPIERKKALLDENSHSTHLAGLLSKRISLSYTDSKSTPNKRRLSGSPKKRRQFPLDSDIFEGQANVVNEECHVSRKPARQSRQVYKERENSFGAHLKILKSNKSSRSSKNIKWSSSSSSEDGSCETRDVDELIDADEADASDQAGDPDKEESKMNWPDQGRREKDSEIVIERNCEIGSSSPAAAASIGDPPSLDDPGNNTANDSLNSTMAGSELRFASIPRSKDDHSPVTGEYRIARGIVKYGLSVFFIHLSEGYLAFKTPLNTIFIGMTGEGWFKQVNENMPAVEVQLRPGTEIKAGKDAVVAIRLREGCSSFIVVMVTSDD